MYRGGGPSSSAYGDDDDDRPRVSDEGTYKVPDRDFYRKNINTFSSIAAFLQSRLYVLFRFVALLLYL